MGRRDLGGDEAAAGQRQHAAHAGRGAVGKEVQPLLPHRADKLRQAAAKRREVPVALGSQCAGHRQHEPEVLNQNGRVVDAAAQRGPQRHLDRRNQHHQRERQRSQGVVN